MMRIKRTKTENWGQKTEGRVGTLKEVVFKLRHRRKEVANINRVCGSSLCTALVTRWPLLC